MSRSIEGIIAPITTPFRDDGLGLDLLEENITKYAKTSLAGFLVLGSNGESKSLSEDERRLVLQIAIDAKSPTQFIIAGIAVDSTRVAISHVNQAAELGADYVSLLTPFYFKSRLDDGALLSYFTEVADHSALPVLVYNAPKFTGINLSTKVVEEISKHPNIVGMKDTSSGNYIHYMAVVEHGFRIFAGSLNTLLPALLLGAKGGVVSMANAFPEACCRLYDVVKAGDLDAGKSLYLKLVRLNRLISGSFSVAGVKYAMDLADYNGGDPRRPLLQLSQSEKDSIKQAIQQAGVS